MARQAHRGQVIVELLIIISVLLAFFWFADSLATDAQRGRRQSRFPSTTPYRK